MCNIIVVEKDSQIPTAAVLELIQGQNQDGHGIAWADGGMIHVRRSLDRSANFLDRRFLEKLPRPFIIHFRMATMGEVAEYLAHPFAMEVIPDRRASFKTASPILFHNGHIGGTALEMLEALAVESAKAGKGARTGQWSDSRILASALSRLNKDQRVKVLETLSDNNRFAVLTPRGKVKRYGRWYVAQDSRYFHSSSIGATSYSGYSGKDWRDQWKGHHGWGDDEMMTGVVKMGTGRGNNGTVGSTKEGNVWPNSHQTTAAKHCDYVSAKDGDRVFKSFDEWVAYKEAERLASEGRIDEASAKLDEAETAHEMAALDQCVAGDPDIVDPVDGIADTLNMRRGPDSVDAD